jgi:tetratricopeptide (TPR) repeat protein
LETQLTQTVARWFSVLVSCGAGLALVSYGLYIRLGYSKQYFLRKTRGLLGPRVYHVLPLAGVVLCLVGIAGLPSELETRQRLVIYLVAPSFILTLLMGLNQPSWLKPRWLGRLQQNHPDIYPFLRDVAREEVGDDPGKAGEWAEEMDVGEKQEAWVAGVRKRRGWPRRELHSPEQPSVKVPRRFRRQIAQVQGLPPSSKGLEEQIVTYEGILSQLGWEEEPAFWATVQNKLGIAYAARRRGDRAENVERAIAAYEAALVVTQKRKLLLDGAMIQNNLGAAYRRRIRGEKADNLEKAISAYEAALEVFNREEYPTHWAGTESSLGYAYFKRVVGERKESLDRAIAAYRCVLEVYTEEAFPEQRAQVQKRLEEAVRERART